MISAAIYARVSSARQKKDETIASQTAALRAHADRLGLSVPDEWVFEDEGHSGATLVRPALERLRDLIAGIGIDVVLCYSPDRLARKFAYQALLLEEFIRAGTRVEFIKGPRGDSPEDQLLVQFQGMFAEYEKAQIMERYRRGKAHRAKTGSINVLSGAPFGYRYIRKSDHAGAAYEIVEHEAALVARCFAAMPTRAPRSPSWPAGCPTPARLPAPASIAGTARWCGACCATRPTPAPPCSARPWWCPNPRDLTGSPDCRVVTRRRRLRPSSARANSGPRSPCRPSSKPTPSTGSRTGWPTTNGSPRATARLPRCCKAWRRARPADTATTAPRRAPRTRRSTTTGAWAPTTTATKADGWVAKGTTEAYDLVPGASIVPGGGGVLVMHGEAGTGRPRPGSRTCPLGSVVKRW